MVGSRSLPRKLPSDGPRGRSQPRHPRAYEHLEFCTLKPQNERSVDVHGAQEPNRYGTNLGLLLPQICGSCSTRSLRIVLWTHPPSHITHHHHTTPHTTAYHHTPLHTTAYHHTPPHTSTHYYVPPHTTTYHYTLLHTTTHHHTPLHTTMYHHIPPHTTTHHTYHHTHHHTPHTVHHHHPTHHTTTTMRESKLLFKIS